MATMREASRLEYDDKRTLGDLNAGSMQRIADACELMAKDHDRLTRDRDYQKRCRFAAEADNSHLKRSNAALRGQISKLQRQIAALKVTA